MSLVGAAVLLALFEFVGTRHDEPFVPLSIFANRNRSGTFAMMLCIANAIFSMFYFLTQFLRNVLGWSLIKTGVGFLPMTAGIVVAAGVASKLIGKNGIRIPLLIGPAGVVFGLVWVSGISPTNNYLDILGPLLLIALGMGLALVPLTLTAVSGVRSDEAGLASALLNTI